MVTLDGMFIRKIKLLSIQNCKVFIIDVDIETARHRQKLFLSLFPAYNILLVIIS